MAGLRTCVGFTAEHAADQSTGQGRHLARPNRGPLFPAGGGLSLCAISTRTQTDELIQASSHATDRAGQRVDRTEIEKDGGATLEQVQADWFRFGRQIRDNLLNLPSRLSGPFAAEMDQNKIFTMFSGELHQILVEHRLAALTLKHSADDGARKGITF